MSDTPPVNDAELAPETPESEPNTPPEAPTSQAAPETKMSDSTEAVQPNPPRKRTASKTKSRVKTPTPADANAASNDPKPVEDTMTDKTKPEEKTEAPPAETVEEAMAEARAENPVLDEFLNRQQRGFEEAGKALEGLIPEAFRSHGGKAINEFVESYRTLFNGVLDRVINSVEQAKMRQQEEADELIDTLEKAKVDKK